MCRLLLFPLLNAEKGHLRIAIANRAPVSCCFFRIQWSRSNWLLDSRHCNKLSPEALTPKRTRLKRTGVSDYKTRAIAVGWWEDRQTPVWRPFKPKSEINGIKLVYLCQNGDELCKQNCPVESTDARMESGAFYAWWPPVRILDRCDLPLPPPHPLMSALLKSLR